MYISKSVEFFKSNWDFNLMSEAIFIYEELHLYNEAKSSHMTNNSYDIL